MGGNSWEITKIYRSFRFLARRYVVASTVGGAECTQHVLLPPIGNDLTIRPDATVRHVDSIDDNARKTAKAAGEPEMAHLVELLGLATSTSS